MLLVFVAELSFGAYGVSTPLLEDCFALVVEAGRAAFLVRGFVTGVVSSAAVDPEEQAVAVVTSATTNGKIIFLNFTESFNRHPPVLAA